MSELRVRSLGKRATRWLACAVVLASGVLSASVASADTLSADEAVRMAASRNPSLRAALLDVSAAKYATQAEDNARTPVLVASTTGNYSESFGGSSIMTRGDSEGIDGRVAVTYTTEIGTKIEAGLESNVTWRNINGSEDGSIASGPTYGSNVYVTARQPLLRGAGTDVVLAPLVQAESSQTQAERAQDVAASQLALDVLSAYWELWYADEAVAVQERAFEVAKKNVSDAKVKADTLGTGTQVDVLQFSTSLASIQDSLSQAKATRQARAITLGTLLGMAPEQAMKLEATGEAPTLGAAPSVTVLQASLIERSPELAAIRAQLQATEARLLTAKDATQPRVDLFTTVSMGGVWSSDDDLGGAGLPGGRPAFTVYGGLEIEVPLGENRATSDVARVQAQLDAAKQRYQARVAAITAEASTLGIQLEAANLQVDLAGQTVEMATALANAERQRLQLGTASSADVVRADQTQREAELRRLRAIVSRAGTQFKLEHDAGALLDRYGALVASSTSESSEKAS